MSDKIAISQAQETINAARRSELERDARELQLRLGYIAVQECKLAVERQRVLQALLEGEAEYAKLSPQAPSEPESATP